MKIGIITYHFVSNYGGVLQCYALQHYLKKLGHEVQIIDYAPKYHTVKYSAKKNPFLYSKNYWIGCKNYKLSQRAYITARGFLRCMYMNAANTDAKTAESFESFIKNRLDLTKRYTTFEELKNDPPMMDAYITGSDQLWNYGLSQGKYDEAYFLKFGDSSVPHISYAVSAGKEPDEEHIGQLKGLCSELSAVSLREYSKSVIDAIDRDVHICIDPTLLNDAEDYSSAEAQIDEKEPYIFVYGFETNQAIRDAVAVAEKKCPGCKVINASPYRVKLEGNVKNIFGYSPEQFLSYIKNARFVVTNSFHGTSFSVIYKKDFITVSHSKRGSRMTQLLSKLGLDSRLYGTEHFDADTEIDWAPVYEKLGVLRGHSCEFLDCALKGVRGEDIPHYAEDENAVTAAVVDESAFVPISSGGKSNKTLKKLKHYLGSKRRSIEAEKILQRELKTVRRWYVDSDASVAKGYNDARSILIQSHVVEKGLSHKTIKPLFGFRKMELIASSLESYIKKGGTDAYIIGLALSSLEEYNECNRQLGISEDRLVRIPKVELPAQKLTTGAREVTKDEFFADTGSSFPDFCRARHSVRLFDCKSDPIRYEDIVECIDLAKNCPTACNMQPVKVKVITNPDKIAEVSAIQGGSAGFGENSGAILLVTADISKYRSYEYKMAMVDCGIFTMNLVYALYEKHLGSCVLNGNLKRPDDEAKLKAAVPFGETEILAAVISVSAIPEGETVKIAMSPKRNTEDLITHIE